MAKQLMEEALIRDCSKAKICIKKLAKRLVCCVVMSIPQLGLEASICCLSVSQVTVHQIAACSACCLVLQGHQGMMILMLEQGVIHILKGNVYRSMPKSEVACPKKDSITASNWGRFLPALQIKSPLKLFVLCGLTPTQSPNITPPHTTPTPNKLHTKPTLYNPYRAKGQITWIHQ